MELTTGNARVKPKMSPEAKKSYPMTEKTALWSHLTKYGLGEPTALATAIGITRQHAHMILSGKRSPSSKRPYRIGVPIAKRIGEATGLPWTLILEWQENGR